MRISHDSPRRVCRNISDFFPPRGDRWRHRGVTYSVVMYLRVTFVRYRNVRRIKPFYVRVQCTRLEAVRDAIAVSRVKTRPKDIVFPNRIGGGVSDSILLERRIKARSRRACGGQHKWFKAPNTRFVYAFVPRRIVSATASSKNVLLPDRDA